MAVLPDKEIRDALMTSSAVLLQPNFAISEDSTLTLNFSRKFQLLPARPQQGLRRDTISDFPNLAGKFP